MPEPFRIYAQIGVMAAIVAVLPLMGLGFRNYLRRLRAASSENERNAIKAELWKGLGISMLLLASFLGMLQHI